MCLIRCGADVAKYKCSWTAASAAAGRAEEQLLAAVAPTGGGGGGLGAGGGPGGGAPSKRPGTEVTVGHPPAPTGSNLRWLTSCFFLKDIMTLWVGGFLK